MARSLYGMTTADYSMTMGGRIIAGAEYAVWSAEVGGTRVTDLLTRDGAASTVVVSDAYGRIGFFGPDETKVPLWLDGGVGPRVGIVPLDNIGQKGDKGDVGAAGPSQPTGTGSPEGTRPGSPGDVWVQTNHPVAVGGVLVWRKITGTGTTGWVVESGKTPAYDIRSLLINGWTASVALASRSGDQVTLEVQGLSGSAASSDGFLPSSFVLGQPDRSGNFSAVGLLAATGVNAAESAVVYLSVTSAAYAVSRARVTGGWGRLSWTTRSPMPTAAPV